MPRRAYVIERLRPEGEGSMEPPTFYGECQYGNWGFTDGDPRKLKVYASAAEALNVVDEMSPEHIRRARVRRIEIRETIDA